MALTNIEIEGGFEIDIDKLTERLDLYLSRYISSTDIHQLVSCLMGSDAIKSSLELSTNLRGLLSDSKGYVTLDEEKATELLNMVKDQLPEGEQLVKEDEIKDRI